MDLSEIRRASKRQLSAVRSISGKQLARLKRESARQLSRIAAASGNQLSRIRKESGRQLTRLKRVSQSQLERIRKYAENRPFSRMNEIPAGQASDTITEGCLVLEGGAFRGLYSQGVMDTLMENDLNFRCVIGVSAGALSGYNYCSGQIGRSARINLGYRHDSRYVGLQTLKKAHSPVNLDFILKDINEIEPFNEEYFRNPERRFVAVCANVN
ncbi:MAG: patatin-like phospholipase family protein, partial [Erysipelotrichaceae bacterium]|nr:patatin-like phospholipase family protein [Erysipelotrichaceae bacterium]